MHRSDERFIGAIHFFRGVQLLLKWSKVIISVIRAPLKPEITRGSSDVLMASAEDRARRRMI